MKHFLAPAALALMTTSAFAQATCDDLWYSRNAIFKEAGYCFKTTQAIRTFGNARCQYDDINDVPLSNRQRQEVNEIRRAERVRGCPQ